MKIHVSLGDHECEKYRDALHEALHGGAHEICDEPEEAEFLVFSPDSAIRDFSTLEGLRFVQSIWAGVDSIVQNETLRVPLARMVDKGLSEGMREYVLGHILADHIEIRKFEEAKQWDDEWLPLARSKTVGFVGVGELGQACAKAALAMGFNVLGWSNSPKDLAFPTSTAANGLHELLGQSDYVVTLLPHTPQTEDMMNAAFFAAMKNDAMLINPGSGALLDEEAHLEA